MYPNMIIVLISIVEMELILPEMYPIMIIVLNSIVEKFHECMWWWFKK